MQQHHIVTIDDDVYGWLLSQASALRARDHFSLDWDNLAEELEEMAALRRDALQSDLEILLLHCLKLACGPGQLSADGENVNGNLTSPSIEIA